MGFFYCALSSNDGGVWFTLVCRKTRRVEMNGLHTHYDNLKVARNAPPEVIRAAYKTLCSKFHPDHHPDNPSVTHTFQLISAAYKVLSDPASRREHDQWIARSESRQPEQTAQASQTSQAPRRHQVRRRADRRQIKTIHMQQAWSGVFTQLRQPSQYLIFWVTALLIALLLALLF
jgi:DnaJ-class molecular chaperone